MLPPLPEFGEGPGVGLDTADAELLPYEKNVFCRDAQRRVRYSSKLADAPLGVPTIPAIVKTVLP